MSEKQVNKIVYPTRGLLQGGPYVPATSTDLKKRFDEIRATTIDFNDDHAYRRLRAVRSKK